MGHVLVKSGGGASLGPFFGLALLVVASSNTALICKSR